MSRIPVGQTWRFYSKRYTNGIMWVEIYNDPEQGYLKRAEFSTTFEKQQTPSLSPLLLNYNASRIVEFPSGRVIKDYKKDFTLTEKEKERQGE